MALKEPDPYDLQEVPDWCTRATVRYAASGQECLKFVKLRQVRAGDWWSNHHIALRCSVTGERRTEQEELSDLKALNSIIRRASEPALMHGKIHKDADGRYIQVGRRWIDLRYLEFAENQLGVEQWDQAPGNKVEAIVGYRDDEPVAIIMPCTDPRKKGKRK